MTDKDYMAFALQLAKQTAGQTSPNPVVGAVVVKDGEIVGFGAHLKAGEAHAEVNAIQMAGSKAKGAVIYVTLEPCSHFGKTPPCADLIIKSGIKRAVVAMTDPNPMVAGKGIEKLLQAGIEVEVGVLYEEAKAVNKIFFHYIKNKLPFVTLKAAASLDGKIATKTGASKWITGSKAREDVHRLRHQHDAILVGVNTVIKDNPQLTTRLPNGGKNPIRVILDTNLRIPNDSQVLTDGLAQTWIITGSHVAPEQIKRIESEFVSVIPVDGREVTISKLLQLLGERGVTSLFVEGGAQVHGSFLKSKMFQQVILYIAPKLIGGAQAPTWLTGEGFASMADALSLTIESVEHIGEDIKIVATPREG